MTSKNLQEAHIKPDPKEEFLGQFKVELAKLTTAYDKPAHDYQGEDYQQKHEDRRRCLRRIELGIARLCADVIRNNELTYAAFERILRENGAPHFHSAPLIIHLQGLMIQILAAEEESTESVNSRPAIQGLLENPDQS